MSEYHQQDHDAFFEDIFGACCYWMLVVYRVLQVAVIVGVEQLEISSTQCHAAYMAAHPCLALPRSFGNIAASSHLRLPQDNAALLFVVFWESIEMHSMACNLCHQRDDLLHS